MNKRQKIALLIIAIVWVWIAFGGPYNARTYTVRGLVKYATPQIEIVYYFDAFTEILQGWIALLIPAAISIYLLKTHK
jgi:hypothetical protein